MRREGEFVLCAVNVGAVFGTRGCCWRRFFSGGCDGVEEARTMRRRARSVVEVFD